MGRLRILSGDDFDKLYTIPELQTDDYSEVFELDAFDYEYINSVSDLSVKIDYVLQSTYFRLSQYFFNFTFQSTREDVWYVIKTFFPEAKFPKRQITDYRKYQNRRAVLKKYQMILCSSPFQAKMARYARELVKQHNLSKYIFDSLLSYCHEHKVVRPSYSILQAIVATAIGFEKRRLASQFNLMMTATLRKAIDSLLEKDDDYYQLTAIRQDQKDFKTKAIRLTVDKQKSLALLYEASIEIMQKLEISEQNSVYYADLAMYYTIYGLKELKQRNLSRLYLICYAYRRYLKLNDHLLESLNHKTNKYLEKADEHQNKEHALFDAHDATDRKKASKMLELYVDYKVSDSQLRPRAFEVVDENKIVAMAKRMKQTKFNPDQHRWEFHNANAHRVKHNLRQIFDVLTFQTQDSKLAEAIRFFKAHLSGNKTNFEHLAMNQVSMDFVPMRLRRYLYTKIIPKGKKRKRKVVNINTYEFMLYWQLNISINHGKTHVRDSLSYRSLQDELLPKNVWDSDKDSLIDKLNNRFLKSSVHNILGELRKEVITKYNEVNTRILCGDNRKIKIKRDKEGNITGWKLPQRAATSSANDPLFADVPTSNIGQVIRFANQRSNLIKEFYHILPMYSKTEAELPAVSACVVAKGMGTEIKRMEEICDIKGQTLLGTSKNFIRLQTVSNAANKVINLVEKLPLFKKYNLSDYGVHASVDGQKFLTRFNIVKSRYSSKYFGLGKGVSAYTLFANFLPLCSKVIGANEHESHYLLDILHSNTSNVKIDAVSGDMHSINRVNFDLLFLFGYRFMPRFTKLEERTEHNLVHFLDPESFKKHPIKPKRKINTKLITKEWDNILHIVTTLGLKKNTQSQIIRKLSSHRVTDTMKALIEFDRIIRTLYLLDYLDDENVRTNVQRALNRGESYHQLRSAISKPSGRKLQGKTEFQIALSNECARLIAVCIIFYNASILSAMYDCYKQQNNQLACDRILKISPVAWQHINLIGVYQFNQLGELPQIELIVNSLIYKEAV